MPSVTVFRVNIETGDPKPVGSFSFKVDETFADARLKLEKLGNFDFEFIDFNLRSRMVVAWEKGNHLEDCHSKIIIIPKDTTRSTGGNSVEIRTDVNIGSNNASNGSENGTSGIVSLSEDSQMPSTEDDWLMEEPPVGDDIPDAVTPIEAKEPQTNFQSKTMPKDLEKLWMSFVDKLKEHMKFLGCEHHKWRVKTWDKDLVPCGKIYCIECDLQVWCDGWVIHHQLLYKL